MTGREWQHALYLRDRWNVNPKLTLDLGLRWEYYPIMTRADGRGLERLDLDTRLRELESSSAAAAATRRTSGSSRAGQLRAARSARIYRLNEETVLRGGYGITYNAMGWARPMRGDQDYPVTISSSFTQRRPVRVYNRLEQGIPLIAGPDQSTGRVPLPNAGRHRHAGVGQRRPRPRPDVERRVRASAAVGHRRSTSPTSARRATAATPGWTSTCRRRSAAATRAGRIASLGRQNAIQSWGQRLQTDYDSLQVALNKPFTRGLCSRARTRSASR